MIKNILVRGNIFGDRYSNSHCLENDAYSLWKVKFNKSMTNYKLVDCICCNITDTKRDISSRLKYMDIQQFNQFLFDNGML